MLRLTYVADIYNPNLLVAPISVVVVQKDEANRLLREEAAVNARHLSTKNEQLEVNNQLLAIIRRDNETLKTAMVDMLDDIRRLNAIAGETGGWADVLL